MRQGRAAGTTARHPPCLTLWRPPPSPLPRSARTTNENGPGAESAPTNAVAVGVPAAPQIASITGASGYLRVVFSPVSPVTGDSFHFVAVDSTDGQVERTAGEAEVMSFTALQSELGWGGGRVGLGDTGGRSHKAARGSAAGAPHACAPELMGGLFPAPRLLCPAPPSLPHPTAPRLPGPFLY